MFVVISSVVENPAIRLIIIHEKKKEGKDSASQTFKSLRRSSCQYILQSHVNGDPHFCLGIVISEDEDPLLVLRTRLSAHPIHTHTRLSQPVNTDRQARQENES